MKDTLPYCPACGHAQFIDEYEICHHCGFQYGYDDATLTHKKLEELWQKDPNYFWGNKGEK